MSMLSHFFDFKPEALALDEQAMELCQPYFRHMEEIRDFNQLKMLKAFADTQMSSTDMLGTTGYGLWDTGRAKLEQIFAEVMGAEDALVRSQFQSGTHTLAVALFGLLRAGDTLLAATGRPYDTLEGVIGLDGKGKGTGTLMDYGVKYDEAPLKPDFTPDYDLIAQKAPGAKVCHIQRSRGYLQRNAFDLATIRKIADTARAANPEIIVFVDNCYGEFTQTEEPCQAGADLVVGSLIKNAGGGIQSTTNATRQASEQELAAKASKALDEMMGFGTTTVEAKSGYGLATEHELKALEVIKDLNDHHRMDLVATFMGAHLVPAEYKSNRAEYVRLVCEEMMPRVKEQGIAKFCDVFCEADTFTVEESRQVLEAGLKYGLRPKIHADEIEAIGGSQLAGEIGAISAEHLIVCPPEGISSMARGGVIACLLPATSFNLGAVFAPARDMVAAGVPVAMATDFNPGSCPCLNMQFVINLGCLKYKLTPEEVLTAVTLNGAAAIDLADKVGSVEEGKLGDLVIWDAPDLDYICYRVGSNLAKTVIKRGEIV